MPTNTKQTNRDLIENLSGDLRKVVKDIFFIKNELKVLSDKLNIIQQEHNRPSENSENNEDKEHISTGWLW